MKASLAERERLKQLPRIAPAPAAGPNHDAACKHLHEDPPASLGPSPAALFEPAMVTHRACTSQLAHHILRTTRYTSYISHITHYTLHITYITHHTLHITHHIYHTSHITHYTSHISHISHISHVTHHTH